MRPLKSKWVSSQKTWKKFKMNFTKAVMPNRNWNRKPSQGSRGNQLWQYGNCCKISNQASINNMRANGTPGPTRKSKIPNRPSLRRPSNISHHNPKPIWWYDPNHYNPPSGPRSTNQTNRRRNQWQLRQYQKKSASRTQRKTICLTLSNQDSATETGIHTATHEAKTFPTNMTARHKSVKRVDTTMKQQSRTKLEVQKEIVSTTPACEGVGGLITG